MLSLTPLRAVTLARCYRNILPLSQFVPFVKPATNEKFSLNDGSRIFPPYRSIPRGTGKNQRLGTLELGLEELNCAKLVTGFILFLVRKNGRGSGVISQRDREPLPPLQRRPHQNVSPHSDARGGRTLGKIAQEVCRLSLKRRRQIHKRTIIPFSK